MHGEKARRCKHRGERREHGKRGKAKEQKASNKKQTFLGNQKKHQKHVKKFAVIIFTLERKKI